MTSRQKIAVFTGSRAEYGLLFPTLKRLCEDASLDVRLIVTGTHLSSSHGATASEIARDGFTADLEIPLEMKGDADTDVAHAAAIILKRMAEYMAREKPAALMVLGDRYEVLAAATAALLTRTPIIHLHGGEATEGLIDEAIRHAVSKMAHLHMVSAEAYRQRVIQMGEQPDRVVVMGATCIDNIRAFSAMSKEDFFKRVGLSSAKPFFLVTHHPATLSRGAAASEIAALLAALDMFKDRQILFTGVNADMESSTIRSAIEVYQAANKERVAVFDSLGRTLYYNALHYTEMVVGNSSSGLLEAPFFAVPTVNIGPRQQGRLRGASVMDAKAETDDIVRAIKTAGAPDFRVVAQNSPSPYGSLDTSPAEIIHHEVKKFLADGSLIKLFYTLAP